MQILYTYNLNVYLEETMLEFRLFLIVETEYLVDFSKLPTPIKAVQISAGNETRRPRLPAQN